MTNYIIWNKITGLPKVINADDYSVMDLDRMYRFYKLHRFYDIERIEIA